MLNIRSIRYQLFKKALNLTKVEVKLIYFPWQILFYVNYKTKKDATAKKAVEEVCHVFKTAFYSLLTLKSHYCHSHVIVTMVCRPLVMSSHHVVKINICFLDQFVLKLLFIPYSKGSTDETISYSEQWRFDKSKRNGPNRFSLKQAAREVG